MKRRMSNNNNSQFSQSAIPKFQNKLINWFHKNQRPLPWRKPIVPDFTLSKQYSDLFKIYQKEKSSSNSRDVKQDTELLLRLHSRVPSTTPYGIWVSEIMSQQTRIDVVVPFWCRWMFRFPDSTALANASLEEVQQYWSGLGFYRRCDLMQRGAKALQEFEDDEEKGMLPTKDVASLKQLVPGIGDYTAAAIGSIAFNHPDCPSVDGNVLRVVSRLYGIKNCNVKEKSDIVKITDLAKTLIHGAKKTGDWNQGMMELGATICKPNGEPLCDKCPVSEFCAARKMKEELKDIEEIDGQIPLKSEALAKSDVKALVCILYCDCEKMQKEKENKQQQQKGKKKQDDEDAEDDEEENIRVLVFQRPAGTNKGDRKLLSGFFSFPMTSVSALPQQVDANKTTTTTINKKYISSIFAAKQKAVSKSQQQKVAIVKNAASSFNLESSYQVVIEALSKDDENEAFEVEVCTKPVRHIFSHIDFNATVVKVRVSEEFLIKKKNLPAAKMISLQDLRDHDKCAISNLDEKIAGVAFPDGRRRKR